MATARSPFPGMDPWLEESWGGVHTRLVTYACDQLQEQLGGGLVARLEERVYVESSFDEPQQYVPDVHVYDRGRRTARRPSEGGGGTALAEPKLLPFPVLDVRESYIEIRDFRARERLVTVIEFVSPVNKRGAEGREQYLRKQRDVLRAGVNLMEVDLLRGGKPVTLAASRPGTRSAPYHVSVRRHARPQVIEYFPIALRDRLPAVGVPLRAKDDDAALDLQPLVDLTYRNGRCGEVFDYAKPPVPPLKPADAAWAKRLIADWKRKSA